MRWSSLPPLPPEIGKSIQPGLAGPFTGVVGETILVAGGANFEGEMPWKGGKKSFHDEIYLLGKKSAGSFQWHQSNTVLPEPLAYGGSISTPDGLVCIGGENEKGPLGCVFRISLDADRISITQLPDLPEPLSNFGSAKMGNNIFLTGGTTLSETSSKTLCLDLSALTNGWKAIEPLSFALSSPMMVCQSDGAEQCLYLIGGRCKKEIETEFFSTVLKYSPSSGTWSHEAEIATSIRVPLPTAAATGVAWGSNFILVFSGDRGVWYNRGERLKAQGSSRDEGRRKKAEERYVELMEHHPGFSRDVLIYNTISKKWSRHGRMPGPGQVTTTAFWWNGQVVIPSGEIRPGVRTAEVRMTDER
jgi:cyclically-permuted mutarotase family protein